MWWYLAAALIGAAAASRKQPSTPCVKREAIGPRTGSHYRVDEFPQAGFVVVHAQDGTQATLSKADGPGFVWKDGKGQPATLGAIRLDFLGEEPSNEKPPLRAVETKR